jgi:capsular exopolysaccharide synthesis family protein
VPPGREAAAAASRREPVRHATIEGIGTAVAEAYGSLQTNIAYTTSDAPIKLLLITSSMPGEGKTTTAVNLALTFGQRGLRVLLMDTDLRRGTIHGIFEGARGPGISEVLRGSRQLSDVVRVLQLDEGEAMHYVPTGSLPSYPTQLLESEAMRELLLKARNEYDMVILDSPPVNMITDAAILGALADGVLLVARAGRTASPAMSYAMAQLGHVRARILGAVLNDIDFKRDSVYDSSYQYYSNARYTAETAK